MERTPPWLNVGGLPRSLEGPRWRALRRAHTREPQGVRCVAHGLLLSLPPRLLFLVRVIVRLRNACRTTAISVDWPVKKMKNMRRRSARRGEEAPARPPPR